VYNTAEPTQNCFRRLSQLNYSFARCVPSAALSPLFVASQDYLYRSYSAGGAAGRRYSPADPHLKTKLQEWRRNHPVTTGRRFGLN